MIIIGIAGKKRSGKDTFAQHLKNFFENKNKKVQCESFASPIKKCLQTLFYLSNKELEDQKETKLEKLFEHSPRDLMKSLGDWSRGIGKNIFVQNMNHRIEQAQKNNVDYFIISDVRFDNEAYFIRNIQKGFIVGVNAEKRLHSDDDKHITELGINKLFYDAVIENNTSVEEFKFKINMLIFKHNFELS